MYMLGISGAEIVKTVRDYIEKIIIYFAELWFWPAIFLGIMLLAVIVLATLVRKSYENKILKSVNKLNKYFLSKPFITEENLVEFNLKMKKVPKVLRNNWQIYMLNREDSPSKYINVETCIDKPLKTGSIEKNMQNFSTFTILLAILSFVAGLQYASISNENQLIAILFDAVLVPLLLVIMYAITMLAVRASKNDIYARLYEDFPLYERNLTKAVTTLPAYVDYEILFTKREIKEGIPILQQYLEKRALVEQQELEKARENSVAVEEYDFSDLGVDGSLILERSMKESETFIKIKRRLQDEIGSIETEMANYKKNYEETVKDMQRKLQASRENLESLKTQQEESTNRIESNYIRKQQADEIKKQQQLEKDIEEATAKFNDEQTSLKQDIEKRENEISEKKEFVEQAMSLEFKHYANTLYKALTEKATEVGNQRLLTLAQENSDLKVLLTDIQGVGGAEVDIEDSLIQKQDLTSENLYDMSTNDMNELGEAREQSDKESNEEAKNEQPQQPAVEPQPKTEEIAKPEPQPVVEEPQPTPPIVEQNNSEVLDSPVQENVPIQEPAPIQESAPQVQKVEVAEPIVTNENLNETEKVAEPLANDVSNVKSESVEVDSNEQFERGEPVREKFVDMVKPRQEDDFTSASPTVVENDDSAEKPRVNAPSEDLEQIQKQIDENNKILQQNRQEFENDLNKTISKIDDDYDDDYDDEEVDAPSSRQERAERHDFEDRNEYEEDREGRRYSRRAREDYEEEETPRKRRATSRKIVDDEPRRADSRRGGRRPSTSRGRRDFDGGTDIDELNAEMQKLLNRK